MSHFAMMRPLEQTVLTFFWNEVLTYTGRATISWSYQEGWSWEKELGRNRSQERSAVLNTSGPLRKHVLELASERELTQTKHVIIFNKTKHRLCLVEGRKFLFTKILIIIANFKHFHALVNTAVRMKSEEATKPEVPQMCAPITLGKSSEGRLGMSNTEPLVNMDQEEPPRKRSHPKYSIVS